MNNLMNLMKRFPWWGWVGIFFFTVAVFIFLNHIIFWMIEIWGKDKEWFCVLTFYFCCWIGIPLFYCALSKASKEDG